MSWVSRPFEECIEPVTYSSKVQRKDFLAEGAYPVISQEDAFINGFWDRASDVFPVDRAVIVFGDHTRVLKYIDFDFVLGADGVKVLRPKPFLNSRFFYYQLHTANLESLGYARHYRLLKAHQVAYPSYVEQQRIVGILDEAFAGITTAKANAEKSRKNARDLFNAQLNAEFSDRVGGRVRLDEIFDIGSSKRVLKSEWKNEGVPFYRGREVTRLALDGYVDNDLFISEKHYAELAAKTGVPSPGDIVITAIGTIGNAHIVRSSDRFYFKDASVLWMKQASGVSSDFAKLWIRSAAFHEQLDRGNGATVDTLTIGKLQSLEVCIPAADEQSRIVRGLALVEQETRRLESLYKSKLAALDELKQSLLHQAFSGQL